MKVRLKQKLELVYERYNRRAFVDPDPLLFLYDYQDVRDREVAGLVAACLAYGRVEMIMQAAAKVLAFLGPCPRDRTANIEKKEICRGLAGFTYRFATEAHISALILGMQQVIRQFGSLEACFIAGTGPADTTVLPGLAFLVQHLDPRGDCGHLLADPLKSSACKRSHLFLRWMVRKDRVDPGGWDRIRPDKLLIPLDRHMFTAGQMLGFTRRRTPDRTACLEITQGFRKIVPHDPVKYDFSLTRFGIQRTMDMTDLQTILTG